MKAGGQCPGRAEGVSELSNLQNNGQRRVCVSGTPSDVRVSNSSWRKDLCEAKNSASANVQLTFFQARGRYL